MSNLTVALLGSEGFIGRHIAQSCIKNGISVLDLQRWTGKAEDFDDQIRDLRSAKPNSRIVLIQAAWYSTDNLDYRTSNLNKEWVATTKAIVEICQKHNIVFAGLGTCLEKLQSDGDLYSSSKFEILSYLESDSLTKEWIWFQLHYVYSSQDLKPAVLRKADEANEAAQPIALGTPHDRHDFIDVRDAADAIVHAVRQELKGTIEIGTGNALEVSQFLNLLFPNLKIKQSTMSEARPSYQGAADVRALANSGWAPSFTPR